MRRLRHPAVYFPVVCVFAVNAIWFCSLTTPEVSAKKPPALPTVRWSEGKPGCTFSRTDDGKYVYGLWSGDVGITLSVDSQELEKVRRRHEPFFSVLLDIRYRGNGGLDIPTQDISLKFVRHYNVVQPALDPDQFAEHVQNDADALDHQTAREVESHPEKKESREAYVRAFQKDAAELIEFVTKNALRPAHLDPGNTEASGWVFFSTQSKWISGWKKQEEFLLRVSVEGIILEFPFKLPPTEGELLLRKRE
jgi:hypothetical protein